ncbi:MAG: glycosyltransferase family 2 protein [Dysgonamonadaceae bacterium]
MTLVSFILPAYKKKFLSQAINSILQQTYPYFELVVVDDCSPEDLKAVVSSYSDERITYIRNSKNIGGENLVKQWTNSIQYAKGDYIVLAADDDLYHRDFLKECIALSEKYPQADLIRSRVEQIDENGGLIGLDGILPEFCSKYAFVFYWLQAAAFTCIGNFMFRASVLKQKGFIDFPCAFGSDTASAINMGENGVANTREMLFKFRISSIHLSSNRNRLSEKLDANTLLFKWLRDLDYANPEERYDLFFFEHMQWDNLYPKCRYDYYNLVIKYLPLRKIGWINRCELLTGKDKLVMFIRYFINKLK